MNTFYIKTLYSFAILSIIPACTPQIKESFFKEWRAVKSYNYSDTFSRTTGLYEAVPNNEEKAIRQDKSLCLHEDAHNREVTVNGIEDKIAYRYCTLTPSSGATLHRFVGK